MIDELKDAVEKLKKRRLNIEAVYLFGSFAAGVPTPKSDADLLIVSPEEKTEVIRNAFLSVSVPVDLYVMSPSSFRSKKSAGKGVVAEAVRKGIRLL